MYALTTDSEKQDNLDSYLVSMRHFNQKIMNFINKDNFNKLLYIYATLALLLPNIALCITERLSFWSGITNIMLPLGIYMLLMSLCKKTGKMIWICFIMIFFAAFQLVLLYLFGKGVIAVDMFLNLVTTNPGEAMELLDNLVPAVAGVFIVYLPLLILGIISIRSKRWAPLSSNWQRRMHKWGASTTITGLLCLGFTYWFSDDYKLQDQLYPANVFYNLGLAVQRNNASVNYQEASQNFRFNATSTHPADSCEVYVMVVGETARAHNFSLYGYQRDTNPLLGKTAGLVAFDKVTTQSNTTHKSVPMLLSAASASDFERLFHEKGILAAFREAGFHTVFLSNQLPNHSFIDFLGEQADEWAFIKTGDRNEAFDKTYGQTFDKMYGQGKLAKMDEKGNVYDADLLPILDQILSRKHQKLFIVLHTYGSHFNYMERYPQNMAHFQPDSQSDAKAENRRDLLNAYDNTIRYTDYVLHSIIERLQKKGGMSAMLYTSDHGENIFDDNRKLFLHAAPRASHYELDVPFLIWTSRSYEHQEPRVDAALSQNKHKKIQSSRSAFHTMLQLGGIATRYRIDRYSVANSGYRPEPLLYLNDHDEAIPQADCGFDK